MSNLIKKHTAETEFFHAGGGKERHDEANSRFPQFCERA